MSIDEVVTTPADENIPDTPVNEIKENLNEYYHDQYKIDQRLAELDAEWDAEKMVQFKAATLLCLGTLLSITGHKRWVLFSLGISIFLLRDTNRRSTMLLPMMRKFGFRTRDEIEKERYALKAIRGDFKYLLDVPNAVWSAVNK